MARISAGRPKRLLAMVFVVASATTAILSLDATVVLLTPVVLATAGSLAVPARPHAYATAHLANTASLLLPVSNLTNLLAFTAAGLSFLHFAAVMALPWLAAIAVEFLLLRWLFARDLSVQPQRKEAPEAAHGCRCSCWLCSRLTLVGFAVTSLLRAFPGMGRAGRCRRPRRARTGPARHHHQPDRRRGRRAVPGVRAVPRGGGRCGDAARPRHRDARRAADRDTLPALLGHRGRRRGAVQRRQQPARGSGACCPWSRRRVRPPCSPCWSA